eukprot:3272176-Pyramimonas_sp.AAC.1
MARVGIVMPTALPILLQGIEYSMLEFTPGCIADRAQEPAAITSDVLVLSEFEGGWRGALHWGPLCHLLSRNESETWTKHHKNALTSLAGGLHWPQHRLHRHSKDQHGRCL